MFSRSVHTNIKPESLFGVYRIRIEHDCKFNLRLALLCAEEHYVASLVLTLFPVSPKGRHVFATNRTMTSTLSDRMMCPSITAYGSTYAFARSPALQRLDALLLERAFRRFGRSRAWESALAMSLL